VTALPLASRALADAYGRVATDLRVSLTDRCNLRCAYCMPPEGLDWLPKDEVLRDDEIVRLIAIGVEQLGIREVRFTGGEPLLRPGLVGIVAATAALRPRPNISLTTNAIGLARRTAGLASAGLSTPSGSSGSPCGTDMPMCSPDWLPRLEPASRRSR